MIWQLCFWAIFLPYRIYHISTSIDFTNFGLIIIGWKIIPKFTTVNLQSKSFLFYTIGISESTTKSSIRWYICSVFRRWYQFSTRTVHLLFWEVRNSHLVSCKIYNADLVERLSGTLSARWIRSKVNLLFKTSTPDENATLEKDVTLHTLDHVRARRATWDTPTMVRQLQD